MKHVVFLVALFGMTAPARAQDWEGDLLGLKGGLHGSVGASWDSKYLWRGFDLFDDVSATRAQADLSLGDTGFGVSLGAVRANSSGFEDRQRLDFTAYYQNRLFADQPYMTQYNVGWVYYAYPALNEGESLDMQEAHLILSWPDLLPIKGLCPSYELVRMWQAQEHSRLADGNGWLHILGLDYGFAIPSLIPDLTEQQTIKLHSELVYNGGFSPTPARPRNDWRTVYPNPDHDWSNAVFGVSTDFNFGHGIILTPALFYQVTLDQSINEDQDELWASIGLKWTF